MVCAMARTDTYPLVDRLVPGGLARFLADARNAGESYEGVAHRLRAEHDVAVSSETVRRWCARTEVAEQAAS